MLDRLLKADMARFRIFFIAFAIGRSRAQEERATMDVDSRWIVEVGGRIEEQTAIHTHHDIRMYMHSMYSVQKSVEAVSYP